jgi:hypothetical protein
MGVFVSRRAAANDVSVSGSIIGNAPPRHQQRTLPRPLYSSASLSMLPIPSSARHWVAPMRTLGCRRLRSTSSTRHRPASTWCLRGSPARRALCLRLKLWARPSPTA